MISCFDRGVCFVAEPIAIYSIKLKNLIFSRGYVVDRAVGALNIAIAGGGIAGLASACLLARRGWRVRVFDKAEKPLPVGSGLILQPSSADVLRALSIEAEIARKGQVLRRLAGRVQPSGRLVLDVDYGSLNKGAHAIGIQRDVLYTVLLKEARAAGAEIVFSSEVSGSLESEGSIHVLLKDGQKHGPFDLLVNALGAQSPLTKTIRPPMGFGALWANLVVPEADWYMADGLEQRYRQARKMAGMLPTGEDETGAQTVAFFWSLEHRDFDQWRATPLGQWKGEVVALWPELEQPLQAITSHDDLIMAKYFHRTHLQPVEGRLVHIGDGWHAASPQLGQGANMALLDAMALADALSRPGTIEQALKNFVRMRRFHVYLYQAISWLFTPFYQSRSSFQPWLRDHITAPLLRWWPVQKLLAHIVAGTLGLFKR